MVLQRNDGFDALIYEKIVERRTIRKFTQESVPKEVLVKCIDAARLSPSAMNRQPLKYVIVNDEELLAEVFGTTSWAGYLPDYEPSEDEMPRAYIIVLLDREIRKNHGNDAGIAVMSMSIVAYEEGLGSCILGAIDRPKLKRILNIPDRFEIVLAVAFGYPAESQPIVEEVKNGETKYWLDISGVLHVPKRKFEDLVKWNR